MKASQHGFGCLPSFQASIMALCIFLCVKSMYISYNHAHHCYNKCGGFKDLRPNHDILQAVLTRTSYFVCTQVIVNGTSYQPSIASNSKKEAKSLAATVALQTMGMLPRDSVQPVTAPPPPPMANAEPPPPHLTQPPQQTHTLRTVPDFDLSVFR